MPEDSDQNEQLRPDTTKTSRKLQDTNSDIGSKWDESSQGSVLRDDDVFSPELKKRIEQAKNRSVDQFLQSIKPEDKNKKKRKIIIGTIISVAVVILGGSWSAFALWYQNPDNAVTDAIAKSLTAKTIGVSGGFIYNGQIGSKFDVMYGYNDGFSGKVEIGVGTDESGQSVVVNTDIVGESDGDMYFKLDNIDKLISTIMQQTTLALRMFGVPDTKIKEQQDKFETFISPMAKKINGKWILYGASEIRKFNKKDARVYECTFKILEDIGHNPAKLADIGVVYFQNRVFVVKESLGVKDGKSGYVVKVDQDAAKRFFDALKNTQPYKDLDKCTNGALTEQASKTSALGTLQKKVPEVEFEIWIDYWTHHLRQVKLSDDKGSMEMDIKFSFDRPVEGQIPNDFVLYEDVAQDMNSLMLLSLLAPMSNSND